MNSTLLTAAVACALATTAAASSSCDGVNVRLRGPVSNRLDKMIRNHVIATDTAYITEPFLEKTERTNRWQTEFWGKYMHAAAPFWVYTGDAQLERNIEYGLANVLKSQEPGGYIGNYPDDVRCDKGWDVWGMKYTLLGLIHYYDAFRERNPENAKKALAAAERLCDYLIAEIGPNGKRGRVLWETGAWGGLPSSSILEPVVWLYNRTKEQRFLDFATFVVKGMSEPENGPRLIDLALKGVSVADRNSYMTDKAPKHSHPNRSKAYEMMSCYQGLVEYYETTGRKDCLDAAVAAADQIIRDEINIAGGCACAEIWFHGAKKQHLPYTHLQETCVTITWMRLVEKLLALTGDPKYADELEKTFYNIYLASMHPSCAEFAAYTPLNGTRWHCHDHCYMHTDCCNANGPRGFLAFLRAMFSAKDDTAYLNFYVSGKETVTLPKSGVKVAFDSYTVYPSGSGFRLVNHTEGEPRFTLALRIPAWSEKTAVTVNGKAVEGVKPGAYCRIDRTWKVSDVVEVKLDMTVRPHFLDHAVAYTSGPIALARDTRFHDGAIDMPYHASYGGGWTPKSFRMPQFVPSRIANDEFWMTFTASIPMSPHYENPEGAKPKTVFFCDYASAGNRWSEDNAYRVWYPCEYGSNE